MSHNLSRRHFLASASTLAASAAAAGIVPVAANTGVSPVPENTTGINPLPTDPEHVSSAKALNLAPAKWIWYPAKRILPNTFFHFRKTFVIRKDIRRATGWIVGDSRYVLFCNGRRIQFGPAPSDPRFTEADPFDLSAVLQKGENALGATVV
jgi:hypothetical protein